MALSLSIPLSCNIGGLGTLIGCGANTLLKDALIRLYDTNQINFTTWWLVGFPIMITTLISSWICILVLYFGFNRTFGFKKEHVDENVQEVIKNQHHKLGHITFAETLVCINFLILACLRIFREPMLFGGWVNYIHHEEQIEERTKFGNGFLVVTKTIETCYITDTSVVLTICLLLFILPSKFPNYLWFRNDKCTTPPRPSKPLLDWESARPKIPWGIIILLGGGFSLADACQKVQIHKALGAYLVQFSSYPEFVICIILCIITIVCTQFLPNLAIITIMLLIISELKTCTNPIYFMLPVTICSSFSFMLPVGTPPNAIAFSYGDIRTTDMMKSGIILILITFSITMLVVNTWGYYIFELYKIPKWAKNTNCSV